MHSMVGSFTPYTRKQQQTGLVRGYCSRFTQCSFACGVTMLILALLFIILGMILLIYIFRYNGCATGTPTSRDGVEIISISASTIQCNRQAMKVLGITFVVSGAVLFGISLVVIKYSRGSEENNVIRATKSSLRANNNNNSKHRSSSEHEPNQMIVSIR